MYVSEICGELELFRPTASSLVTKNVKRQVKNSTFSFFQIERHFESLYHSKTKQLRFSEGK